MTGRSESCASTRKARRRPARSSGRGEGAGLRALRAHQGASSPKHCLESGAPQSADNEGTAGLIEDGAGAIEIQRERLDRLLHVPPDFVKVDVEGHESRVFEGMSALLGRDEAPTLMFESFRIEEDRSMLEKFGYSVFAPCLRGGELGVLVFFVLSGFLITTILLEERTAYGNVDLRAFYIRRALRLLPAFVVFIATMACLKGLGHVPGESWGSFVAALTL